MGGEKAGRRKSLICAALEQAWIYSWPSLLWWRTLCHGHCPGEGGKEVKIGLIEA